MPQKKLFHAEQFTATEWATAEQKAQWANAMASWVLRDFPQEGFTKRLYGPLYTHLYGHIAHYNLQGFYARWFSSIHRQLEWLQYVARGGAYGKSVGDPTWTWSDVEQAFTSWMQASGLVERYQQRCAQAIEARERAQLALLLSKYPDVVTDEAPVEQPTSDMGELLFAEPLPQKAPRFRTVDAVPSNTSRHA